MTARRRHPLLTIDDDKEAEDTNEGELEHRVVVHPDGHQACVGQVGPSTANDMLALDPINRSLIQRTIVDKVIVALGKHRHVTRTRRRLLMQLE